MEITINGMQPSLAKNMILFSDIPNVLRVSDTATGTKAKVTFASRLASYSSDTAELWINGHKIKGVSDPSAMGASQFLCNTAQYGADYIALTLVKAINSFSDLALNYNVYKDTDSNAVIMEAKQIGSQYTPELLWQGIDVIWNISKVNGTSSGTLGKGNVNQVKVEVYANDTADALGSTPGTKGGYITTLTKTVDGNDVNFDLSPLISSLAEHGQLKEMELYVSVINDYQVTSVGNFQKIFFTNGYSVNQGYDFLQMSDSSQGMVAQNFSRGEFKGGQTNKSLLYVADTMVNLSLYTNGRTTKNYGIRYLKNDRSEIYSANQTITGGQNLTHAMIYLNSTYFRQSSYIEITVPDVATIVYNVAKPLDASEGYTRVYWYNSYGGISFFDFCGDKTENRTTKTETYKLDNFGYYEDDRTPNERLYSKSVEVSVTLSTHNIEKDGQWQLFDLQNSREAWVHVNGRKYYIMVTDIKIEEQQSPDIYVGNITYKYLMGDMMY